MPITNEKTMEKQADGTEKEVLTLKFSNGALQQLEDLAKFIEAQDVTDVVKLGVAFIQKIKEERESEKKANSK